MKILNLGMSANNKIVFLDYENTNVEYHLLETPNLIELVQEAIPRLVLGGGDQLVFEEDMGRIVGTTNLVETSDADEIVYAKRIGRDRYSRFAKNRQPKVCSSIVIVLRESDRKYYLWTAMCANLLPEEAWQPESNYNKTHAMAYDEALIQIDTLTELKPLVT
jgi:hypothetical protein